MKGRGRAQMLKERLKDRQKASRGAPTTSPPPRTSPPPEFAMAAVTRPSFALLTLVGRRVEVRTRAGDVLEGILHAAHPDARTGSMGVALRMARRRGDPENALPVPALVVSPGDFDSMSCRGVEGSGAVSGGKLPAALTAAQMVGWTDSEISEAKANATGVHAAAPEDRKLVQWKDDEGEGGLEIDWSSGKGDWDQFAANEKMFNVRSTYNEEIYTTKIDQSSPAYAAQRKRAEHVAREIEAETSRNPHLAEERGQEIDSSITEEDRFGAVVRTRPPPPPSSKRVKPAIAALSAVSTSAPVSPKMSPKMTPEVSPRGIAIANAPDGASASPKSVYLPPHRRGSQSKLDAPPAKSAPISPASASPPPATSPTAALTPQPLVEVATASSSISGPLSPKVYHLPPAQQAMKKPRSLSSAQPLPIVRTTDPDMGEPGAPASPSGITPQVMLSKMSKSVVDEMTGRPRSHSDAAIALAEPPLSPTRTGRASPVIIECSATGNGTKNPLVMERLRVRQAVMQARHRSSLGELVPLAPVPSRPAPTELQAQSPRRMGPLSTSPLVENPKAIAALQLEPQAPEVSPEVLRDFRAFQMMKSSGSTRAKTIEDLKQFGTSFKLTSPRKSMLSHEVIPKQQEPSSPATASSASPAAVSSAAATSPAPTSPAAAASTASPSPTPPAIVVVPASSATVVSKAQQAAPTTPSTSPVEKAPAATPATAASTPAKPVTFSMDSPSFTSKLNFNAAVFTPKTTHAHTVTVTQPPLFAPSPDKRHILEPYYEAMARRFSTVADPSPSHFPTRWPGKGSYHAEEEPVSSLQLHGHAQTSPLMTPHSPSHVPLVPPTGTSPKMSPHGLRPAYGMVPPPMQLPPNALMRRMQVYPQMPQFYPAPGMYPPPARYPVKPPSPGVPGSAAVTAAAHAATQAAAAAGQSSPQMIPMRPHMDYSPPGAGLVGMIPPGYGYPMMMQFQPGQPFPGPQPYAVHFAHPPPLIPQQHPEQYAQPDS